MLFKTTEEVKQYADIASLNIVAATKTINSVEAQHLKGLIGSSLYNSLVTAYHATQPLTPTQLSLLHKCRCVVAPYFCYYYAPAADVLLSESGAHRIETNTNKSAFQYQVNNFRDEQLRKALVASEDLLQFLEENITDYPEWLADEAFAIHRKFFIKTAAEFSRYMLTGNPYYSYYAMRFKMEDVEELYIRPKLSDALFTHLKNIDTTTQAFTPAETTCLNIIKRAIAYYTLGVAMPYLSVKIDERGVTVFSSNTATRDREAKSQDAPAEKLNALAANAMEMGSVWLKRAVEFIAANPDDFEAFTANTSPQAEGNVHKNTIFGLI